MTDLDTFIGDKVEKVDVIFMDVEGSEIETIKGMKNILARSPNVIILTEWTTETYIQNNQTEFENIISNMFA